MGFGNGSEARVCKLYLANHLPLGGRQVLDDITPLLLTLDEEANISRTISALEWARDIVVVDSGSSDRTREILATIPQVRVFDHKFESHASQWNLGLTETGIKSKWVLALDADQVLSPELVAELATLPDEGDISAFEASFVYCVFGQPLRGSLYPAKVVLVERKGRVLPGRTYPESQYLRPDWEPRGTDLPR